MSYVWGEGNGSPLQCSCLENPRDRGAWWVAVCGVAQSRTRLRRRSSSSGYVWRVNDNLTGLQNSYLWDEEIHAKTERCFPFSNCLSQFLAQRSSLLTTALLLFSPFTLLWEHYPLPKVQKLLPGCLQPPSPAAPYSRLRVSSEDGRESSSLHQAKNQGSPSHVALLSTLCDLEHRVASLGLNF